MRLNVVQSHFMPIAKCPFELSPHIAVTEPLTENSERKTVLDVIFECAGSFGIGPDSMRVLELSKRSADLNVLKLPSRDESAVFGEPPFPEWTDPDFELHAGSICNSARLRDNRNLLPRGCQALKGTPARVPVEN